MTSFFDALLTIGLHVVRPVVALSWLPVAASSSVGRRFTVPLALAVAMCVAPMQPAGVTPASLVLLALKEAAVGFGAGLLVSRVFVAVGAAGAWLDQQAGYTAGASFNPTFGAATGPLESIFGNLLMLSLVQGGAVMLAVKGMIATYEAWPVGSWAPEAARVREWLGSLVETQGQWVLEVALRVASPLFALLLLADVCVAVAARHAQQLNPFSLSLAIKAAVAMIGLVAMSAYPWADILEQTLRGTIRR
ncbi:EscT/YscT/HrcT family type III secretion system export apparatus protein [Luteibacter sp. CQ10]|uniref:EscT/YscT/HrcT family type III secretion system export apparatus protein n=1 Tax=Luteibacter sp. CQ10 TaxID=2805821 RepID=UPI0034A5B36F